MGAGIKLVHVDSTGFTTGQTSKMEV